MDTKPCPNCKGTGRIINQVALGEQMRSKRLSSGASLRSVARMMGISAPYLSDLELGRRIWGKSLIKSYLKVLKIM
jgi:transcriptional regulator with XRE-family HTH domain